MENSSFHASSHVQVPLHVRDSPESDFLSDASAQAPLGFNMYLLSTGSSAKNNCQKFPSGQILFISLSHFDEDTSWRFSPDRRYSTSSANIIQFLGLSASSMSLLAWKPWASPKYKFFVWLVIQSRIWTVNRLQWCG